MIEIDDATGLPVVPDGYRWNVSAPVESFGYWDYRVDHERAKRSSVVALERVSKRERTVLKRSWYSLWLVLGDKYETVEDWRVVESHLSSGTNAIAIQNAARHVYKKWQATLEREKHYGTYPPKSLNLDWCIREEKMTTWTGEFCDSCGREWGYE